MRGRYFWLALAIAAGLTGCGPGNGLTLGKVRGKITYKGQPVTYGMVTFAPDESKGTQGPLALGTIATDGTYIMSTEQSGDGAIVGSHKVGIIGLDPTPIATEASVDPEENPKGFMEAKAKSIHPQKNQPKTATFRTKDGKTYKVVTPEKLMNPENSGLIVKVASGQNLLDITIEDNGSVTIE
jgi:hypothetical protein